MNMKDSTSLVLRSCLIIGIILIAVGLVFSENDHGGRIMWIGLLILIISPFLGILTTYAHLIKDKDRKWAMVATVLIAVIVVGLLISIFE